MGPEALVYSQGASDIMLGGGLTEEQIHQVRELEAKYQDVFSDRLYKSN